MSATAFNGILLVSDMDKTLLDSNSRVSRKNKEALLRFTEQGGRFTVATGRIKAAILPYIQELPINAPAILYNGAMVYDLDKNQIVWQKCLREEILPVLNEVYDKFQDVGVEIYHGDGIYIARENNVTIRHIVRETLVPVMCGPDQVPFPWQKILLGADHSRLLEVEAFLAAKQAGFRTVFSEPQFLEIMEETVSKGAALEHVTEGLGYSLSNTVTVGDNLNDMELIKNAGVGIAVGNAHSALKEIADMCSVSHDEDAIAQVIEWIEKDKLAVKV